jgi:hypothetical protein
MPPRHYPSEDRPYEVQDGRVRAIEIGGYFDSMDGRVDSWWFETLSREQRERVAPFRTPRFHRTLSGWVEIICRAALVIEQFGEPCASLELAEAEPIVADTRVAPLFLHVRAQKPNPATRPDTTGPVGKAGGQ